jgi:D-beta-D-heptose 7-phosphate kinase/D-beta-D-heptose 1-phosphate adenosyltransferase
MTLKADRVKELVTAFADQRILVIGDLMLDRYIYGSVSRISPEAPVPVVQVSRETNMPGGASNVAWNIQALGGSSSVCGFIGRDQAGEDLCALLVQEGVSTEGAIAPDGVKTTVKTRIIAEHQQVVRVDWDDQSPVRSSDMEAFCERIHVMVRESTGVIIEDYGKGVIQQQVVDTVMAAAKEAGVPVGLDPKDNHDLEFKDLTVATPNRSEAYRAVGAVEGHPGKDPLCDQPLLEVGRALQKKWTPELLLMT